MVGIDHSKGLSSFFSSTYQKKDDADRHTFCDIVPHRVTGLAIGNSILSINGKTCKGMVGSEVHALVKAIEPGAGVRIKLQPAVTDYDSLHPLDNDDTCACVNKFCDSIQPWCEGRLGRCYCFFCGMCMCIDCLCTAFSMDPNNYDNTIAPVIFLL